MRHVCLTLWELDCQEGRSCQREHEYPQRIEPNGSHSRGVLRTATDAAKIVMALRRIHHDPSAGRSDSADFSQRSTSGGCSER
jgi:hypothetical protein